LPTVAKSMLIEHLGVKWGENLMLQVWASREGKRQML